MDEDDIIEIKAPRPFKILLYEKEPVKISIENITDNEIIYQAKESNINEFCVVPCINIIKSHESMQIEIIINDPDNLLYTAEYFPLLSQLKILSILIPNEYKNELPKDNNEDELFLLWDALSENNEIYSNTLPFYIDNIDIKDDDDDEECTFFDCRNINEEIMKFRKSYDMLLNRTLKLASENQLILHTNKLMAKEIRRINNKLTLLQNDGIIDDDESDNENENDNRNKSNKNKQSLNLFHILLGSVLGFISGEVLALNLR